MRILSRLRAVPSFLATVPTADCDTLYMSTRMALNLPNLDPYGMCVSSSSSRTNYHSGCTRFFEFGWEHNQYFGPRASFQLLILCSVCCPKAPHVIAHISSHAVMTFTPSLPLLCVCSVLFGGTLVQAFSDNGLLAPDEAINDLVRTPLGSALRNVVCAVLCLFVLPINVTTVAL